MFSEQQTEVQLTFSNLTYRVLQNQQLKDKKGLGQRISRKTILNNISGLCPSKQLTAIMGCSGAGKTSLLNILAKRITNSNLCELQGEILVNQKQYDSHRFAQFAAYVMQNDLLFGTLTVREALQFVADLKYSDPLIKEKKVRRVVKSLMLEKCLDTLIGDAVTKGISGGERKRTSIGIELVSDLGCLLLDEPTSGLDSFTSFVLIDLLKKLAIQHSKTIIFTIHQPSSDIFNLLDRIIMLSEGKIVYQGQKDDLVPYFGKIGYLCPVNSNPLDYLISILNDKKSLSTIDFMIDSYEEQCQAKIIADIQQVNQVDINELHSQTTFWRQFTVVYWRSVQNAKRDKLLFRARVFQIFINALLIGITFLNSGRQPPSYARLQNISGAIFVAILTNFMGPFHPTVIQFPAEREVFLKEENSGLYSTGAYFLGKSMAEIPIIIIFPIILQIIIYWMIGLNDASSSIVLLNLFISVLIALSGSSMGLFVSSLFTSSKVAASMIPMVLGPLVVFSGFFANQQNIKDWIRWLKYLNPIKYGFEALIINEYSDKVFMEDDIDDVDPLKYFNVEFGQWQTIGILIGLIIIYRVLALMLLYGLRERLQ